MNIYILLTRLYEHNGTVKICSISRNHLYVLYTLLILTLIGEIPNSHSMQIHANNSVDMDNYNGPVVLLYLHKLGDSECARFNKLYKSRSWLGF